VVITSAGVADMPMRKHSPIPVLTGLDVTELDVTNAVTTRPPMSY